MLWLKILSNAHVSQSNKPILQYTFKYIYMFGFYVCYFSRDPCLIHLLMNLKTPCQQDPWNRAFYHMVPDSIHYLRPEEQFQPAVVGPSFNLTGKVHGVLYSILPWLQWFFWWHLMKSYSDNMKNILWASTVLHLPCHTTMNSPQCNMLQAFNFLHHSEEWTQVDWTQTSPI